MDTIYIVDDEAALRDSLSMLLEAEDFITQQFADPKLFLSQIDSEQQGLVILDLWMPGMSGIDVIKALNTKGISLPIICITGHGDINTAVEAIKLGAADFFEKPFDSNRLLDQIKHCLKAQQNQRQLDVFSTQAKEKLSKLTPREYEVLQGLVEGLRNKQLAYNMGISIRTVELHRVHVMDKLEAKSLSDVIKIAIAADYEHMTL